MVWGGRGGGGCSYILFAASGARGVEALHGSKPSWASAGRCYFSLAPCPICAPGPPLELLLRASVGFLGAARGQWISNEYDTLLSSPHLCRRPTCNLYCK